MKRIKTDITIIGAGLTGLTLAFHLIRAGKNVLLLEKENRVGGVINTRREQGFIYETGPNTGVIGNTEVVRLFEDLNDKVHLEVANPNSKNRWIWKNGKWNSLPLGFKDAITTPLFTLKDKFRILCEPFRKRGSDPDEPVAGLVIRRLGRSYLDYAVDPFISGIYAGDPQRLITRFALPKLYNLEQKYGSFIMGAIRKGMEAKTELEKKVTREVFSAEGGLSHLINALSSEIGAQNILLNISYLKVNPAGDGFLCNMLYTKNEPLEVLSNKVITTMDGNSLLSVLPFIPKELLDRISNLDYAKVIQVVACYQKWEGIPLNAFGGLVPSKENRNILGILFTSKLFKSRAPNNGAVLSVFLGGIKKPELFNATDDDITSIVQSEIKETLECTTRPDLLKIFRYQKAIPQYEKTTGDRLEAIDKIQKMYPGLILAGNIRDGIGIADRIKQAWHIANLHIQNG